MLPRKILKRHTLGDAFSLILGAKSRAFRTDLYQVTSNKVMMNWSVDCFYCLLYNNLINARTLIGQSAVVIMPVNPQKNRASSELLHKSNRPQVSMGYRLINHLGCW